jgi:putative DNA modification/repair radical SAM protein
MTRDEKLRILADSAKYDASCASSGARRSTPAGGLGNSDGTGICHSYTPDGRCVSLLKILLTNFCVYDCVFCVNRVGNDIRRARFSVEEVVDLTIDFYRRNYIEGLFLSSGIIQSPDYTMEQLVAVARTLRQTHRFGGYIHLKVIPGASEALIDEAGRWADRLSANMELAVERQLVRLAPEKRHDTIEAAMSRIRDGVDAAVPARPGATPPPRFAPAGQSTQMIVGAAADSDAEILATSAKLYRDHALRRVYYSAYSPIPGSDPSLPPAAPPLVREHRLYQADWLMRYYGYAASELTTSAAPDLDLDTDPKMAWALRHPGFFPVDVNADPRERLLRVPGVGRRTVTRLLAMRRHHRVTRADLRTLGVPMKKAAPFVTTADPVSAAHVLDRLDLPARVSLPKQLRLFDAAASAHTGEL